MTGRSFQDVAKSANGARLKALMADLAAGLGFAKLASERAADSAKRERNRRNARKAYDTVVKFAKNVTLASTEERALNDGLAKLKSALEQLGDTF